MAKSSIILLIAILSVGLISSGVMLSGCNASGSSSLTIIVENQSNNSPIAGGNVSISGPESHTVITGTDGLAVFSGIAAGNYTVVVTASGYPTRVTYTIQVNGDTHGFATFSFTRAYFTNSPNQTVINATVSFDASNSNSSGTIIGYTWDFGDGASGTGVNTTHAYAKTGSYTVLLTVTSTVGTSTYSKIVTVVSKVGPFPYPLLLLLLIPIPILIFWRRRRYYVVIQARVPPRHPLCPGDNTECDDCKLTPC